MMFSEIEDAQRWKKGVSDLVSKVILAQMGCRRYDINPRSCLVMVTAECFPHARRLELFTLVA